MAAVTLTGTEKTVTFKKGFGYLRPALKWVDTWTDRDTFCFAEMYDVERQSACWNIRDGLLLTYRTVTAADCPVVPRRRLKVA